MKRLKFAGWWIRHKAAKDLRFVRQALTDCFRSVPDVTMDWRLPKKPDVESISLTWLGHASMVIDFYGVRILTDPVASLRIGPKAKSFVLGPKRYIRFPCFPEDLENVDGLLITHAHLDHLDIPTLSRLPTPGMTITAPNTGDLLPAPLNSAYEELQQWHTRVVESPRGEGGVTVTAFPVNHRGARWRRDTYRLCNGYMLERKGVRIVFIGDTAYHSGFGRIPSILGPADLAVLPIGAYNPFVWNHVTPEQALEVGRLLQASLVIPIHYGTFQLSYEPLEEPLSRFVAHSAKIKQAVITPSIGQPIEIPVVQRSVAANIPLCGSRAKK